VLQAAYAHGLALALPGQVEMARPPAVGRPAVFAAAPPPGGAPASATFEVPIEGRDEWLAAARRLA
jgi:hypothetical protein